ncbi:SCO1664 family protein [Quadrisphaera sp. DSM 44207]|uniref:SCO1664 family protein n=1 Tax=Quadrisphaera sp. DSM 44207 TaxID=1881057 RepID=UPI00350F1FF7
MPPRERVPALTTPAPGAPDPLDLLSRGELQVLGRVAGASNTTLVAEVELDGARARCVYKPVAGEAPLWDFPDGTLAERELAAWLVSSAGGWDVVPPTVLRDGPRGAGSVQLWVGPLLPSTPVPGAGLVDVVPPSRVPQGWHAVVEGSGTDGRSVLLVHAEHPALRRMALFDAVVNNADRKGGHVLRGALRGPGADAAAAGAGGEEPVWGVDHGLTFHCEHKLRTVLWGWAGQRVDDDGAARLAATAAALAGPLADELSDLLTAEEVDALGERVQRLASRGRYPRPRPGWPTLPWPPF